jgi:NAD(P)-dependent dehydrogenase (short-subunit alcohol dehydrogenase family)
LASSTALVTGGARAIGSAACAALAKARFDLAVVSLETKAEAKPILSAVRVHGRNALYVQQDIADIALHEGLN